MPPSRPKLRRGYGVVDLVVALLVAAVVGLFLAMSLTRSREAARAASCRGNLGRIGLALENYNDAVGRLPTVGPPASIEPPGEPAAPGPLKVLTEVLGVVNFGGVDYRLPNPERLKEPTVVDFPVSGFLCPSDSGIRRSGFASPVSYRAATGDSPRGDNGGFAIGRRLSLKDIEAADGLAFTVAFSERLIGDARDRPNPANYALVNGALVDENDRPRAIEPAAADWRGDAGSSWLQADYRSTLYNHAQPPGVGPSLVARDGRSALMGASSGHVGGVHVLFFDRSARFVARTIDPKIWRSMATVEAAPVSP